MTAMPSAPPIALALAIAAAVGAVTIHPGGRSPAGGALAQGGAWRPTAVGEHWPEVAVTGVVLGAPGGTPGPVADAHVIVHSLAGKCEASTRTDGGGGFGRRCRDVSKAAVIELHALAPGHAGRRVAADGFDVGGGTWHLGLGGLGGPERIVLQPAPTAPPTASEPPPGTPTATATPIDRADRLPAIDIAGVVVDSGDSDLPPKAGVRVVAYARPGWCGPSVVTGSDGAFALRCVDLSWRGEVEVHAFDADGGRPDVWARRFELGRAGAWGDAIRAQVPFPIRPGVSPTPILELAYYGRVHGRITDGGSPGSPPIGNAEVRIEGRGSFLAPVRTDGDGAYEIVSPSRWFVGAPTTLVVTAPGRSPYREDLGWNGRLPSALRRDVVLPADETPTPATATPTATPEPSGTEELPDLTIHFANWAADPLSPMCAQYGPGSKWYTTVRIANRGQSYADAFAVAASNVRWDVDGLGPGLTRDLVGPNWVYPEWPIVIDPENVVRESDESNNAFGPDPGTTWTPTPAATQPPTCTPTPTATPTPPMPPALLPWAGRQP